MKSRGGASEKSPAPLKPLPYARQKVTRDDLKAVAKALKGERLTTGPILKEFERAFAAFVGSGCAVAFSSGTAALHAAAHAAGLKPGTEAITTPLTFAATANAVAYTGAKPRFADIDPETLTLDPEKVRQALTDSTKALLPVDYAGHPADLDPFVQMAREKGIFVIEDACHAPGALYKNRAVGQLADITVFSFHPVKHITTGEGGMAVTNSEELAHKLKTFRNHGIDLDADERDGKGLFTYDIAELGYNYRLSDINAALGLSQLSRIEENLKTRRRLAAYYLDALAPLSSLILPVEKEWAKSAWHLFTVRLKENPAGLERDQLLAKLRAEGIGAAFHYPPVHLMTYYRRNFGTGEGDCPVAEGAAKTLITLPLFHSMGKGDAKRVAGTLRALLGARR